MFLDFAAKTLTRALTDVNHDHDRYRGATSRASGWLASAIFSPTLKITGTNLSPRSVLTIVFLAFLEDSLYIIFLSFNVGFRL